MREIPTASVAVFFVSFGKKEEFDLTNFVLGSKGKVHIPHKRCRSI